jgi:triphosphoribosyl-dephospho-CoA synthase
MITNTKIASVENIAEKLAGFAVEALLEEANLTPKPGLVDRANNGVHHDLTLTLLEFSACALLDTFYEMAAAAAGKRPSQALRERLATIGRYGEQRMLKATGGINTHKGAIWSLGLLAASGAILLSSPERTALSPNRLLTIAGAIAVFEDRYAPVQTTNGSQVREKYRVRGAPQEAAACFPSLREAALPAWDKFRLEQEDIQRLNVLLSLMAVVDDTCILHRSNARVLEEVKQRARHILQKGGMGIRANQGLYKSLDLFVTANRVSPGGSADLLAATLFIQKIMRHYKLE